MTEDAKAGNEKKLQTVKDEQIVTVNKFPRRSFLTATGALLGGAVALAAGMRASAQQQDPDKVQDPDKKTDPDKKRHNDTDKADVKRKIRKVKSKVKSKLDDHDKTDKKKTDPDKKPGDPDKKPTDPDGARR